MCVGVCVSVSNLRDLEFSTKRRCVGPTWAVGP